MDQCIHCKTVHPLNVILILNMEMDAVLLVDGVGIRRIIVHVAVVLITEYKVNFEEKISKTRFFTSLPPQQGYTRAVVFCNVLIQQLPLQQHQISISVTCLSKQTEEERPARNTSSCFVAALKY